MFYVLQNESTAALRRVPILLTDAATGTTAQTGVGLSTIFPYVNINGGAFAGGAGTVAEAGYGQYYYEFDASEIATLGLAGIHITASGCRDYDAIVQVAAFNVYSGGGVGISAYDVWDFDISGISTAGSAGTQLNTAASGGAGLTAGDVWSYVISSGDSADITLTNTYNQASNAAAQTSSSSIRDAVWDTDLSYLNPSTQAAGILYQAAAGTTLNAPSEVWSYATRTLTAGGGATAGDIWTYDISAITTSGTAGSQLNAAAAGGAGLTAGDVWAFDITGFGTTGSAALYATNTNYTVGNIETYVANQTPQDIWTYAGLEGRTITGGSVTSVVDPVEITTASMAGIANTVWSTLTAPYTTHATFGHQLLRSDNAATIGEVTLHQSGGSKRVDADVHAFVNNTASATAMLNILTGIGASMTTNITGNITGNLTGSVGSVTANVNVSTASMTGIASTVWNTDVSSFTSPSAGYDVHNGAGTAISAFDVWNYTLLSSGVSADSTLGNADDQATGANTNTNSPTLEANIWSYATRNITGGIVTSVGDKTGYSLSGTQSFNLTGNITGSVSGSVGSVIGSVGSVVNPVGVSTTSRTGIAGTVWTYGTRTLTSAATGITAGDVWTYNIASISTSGSAGKQLNDAAVSGSVVTVVNGPYVLTSIAEGTDGQLDILRNSVQTIQLNLVDGNGSPFNIGGNYTVSVDVYDVSGALTATYTPTVEFAGNGIISFDIDTDVTGTDGRYTLVVSLTDGDVIKLGPLNILVRPL